MACTFTLDGTLLPIDRMAADRPYYSGKHRSTGWIVDDELWALIEPLLPPWQQKAPSPKPVDDRLCSRSSPAPA